MEADVVVNHYQLKEELAKAGHRQVDYILDFVDLEGFTVDNLKKAHQMQESGKTIGKTVIQF